MKKISKYLPLWNFIIITGIILGFSLLKNIGYDSWYYDCDMYRALGNELFSNDGYNLLNLSTGFRGFIFPTILGLCEFVDKKFGMLSPVSFKILISLIYGFFFACVIPKLMVLLFGCKARGKNYSAVMHLALVMLFFWGLFIYPLTDLFAMVLCVNAVICLLSADYLQGCKKILMFFFTGIFMYAAYNVRSIYLFSVLATIIVVVVINLKKDEGIKTLFYLFAFQAGMLFCSIPQIIINYHQYGSISMMLPTGGLMSQQLEWGIYYQRYETYVGTSYNTPKLIFQDWAGTKILERAGDISSIREYILLCFRYPLDFIGIYARHIINMLCPIYPEQYIYNLEINRNVLVILNYILLYVFGVWCTVLLNYKRRIGDSLLRFLAIVIMLLPSIAIMPGALEQRFSIMIYVLILGCISYAIDYKLLLNTVKLHWIRYLWMFGMGLFIVLAVWGNTLSSLQYNKLIIGY